MSDVSDVYGRKIGLFTVDGLLENTKVKTINGQPVTNLHPQSLLIPLRAK